MNLHRIVKFALVAALLLTGFGGVGVVAAHDNDNPDHPACLGEKYKISSEGANVAGDKTGSKWFVKPICNDTKGKPTLHNHGPDNKISIPESANKGYHCNARDVNDNFGSDAKCKNY